MKHFEPRAVNLHSKLYVFRTSVPLTSRHVDWKALVETLYPRPRTGTPSIPTNLFRLTNSGVELASWNMVTRDEMEKSSRQHCLWLR